MNWIAAFQLFTVGGLLIHFRPDQQGTTWGFILLVAGIIWHCVSYAARSFLGGIPP